MFSRQFEELHVYRPPTSGVRLGVQHWATEPPCHVSWALSQDYISQGVPGLTETEGLNGTGKDGYPGVTRGGGGHQGCSDEFRASGTGDSRKPLGRSAHPGVPGRPQTYPTMYFRAQNGAKTLPSCPSLKGTGLVIPLTLIHTAKAQGTQEAGRIPAHPLKPQALSHRSPWLKLSQEAECSGASEAPGRGGLGPGVPRAREGAFLRTFQLVAEDDSSHTRPPPGAGSWHLSVTYVVGAGLHQPRPHTYVNLPGSPRSGEVGLVSLSSHGPGQTTQ